MGGVGVVAMTDRGMLPWPVAAVACAVSVPSFCVDALGCGQVEVNVPAAPGRRGVPAASACDGGTDPRLVRGAAKADNMSNMSQKCQKDLNKCQNMSQKSQNSRCENNVDETELPGCAVRTAAKKQRVSKKCNTNRNTSQGMG